MYKKKPFHTNYLPLRARAGLALRPASSSFFLGADFGESVGFAVDSTRGARSSLDVFGVGGARLIAGPGPFGERRSGKLSESSRFSGNSPFSDFGLLSEC